MDPSILWSIVGAVGAILVTVLIGWVSYRRQFPKKGIEWWLESSRMIASASAHIDNILVKVNGIDIADPYLNTITFRSNSRADIATSSFDDGKPILVHVKVGGALQLESSPGDQITFGGGHGEGFDWAEIPIEPQLIRRRASGRLVFVSSGPPQIFVESTLVDIEIRRIGERRESWVPNVVARVLLGHMS